MNTRLFFSILFLLPLGLANAATYYVDASLGNDSWSGNQSSPIGSPATDGPWQSLAKVSSQPLAAGDSVLLKCGGIWNEMLTLSSSGSAASPITIGSYPNACANKPVISGAIPVPAHNWVRDTGNIYKLSSNIDLITSGTFENGFGSWRTWSLQNNSTLNSTTSCAQTNSKCASFSASSGYGVLSSNYFTVQGRRTYTATFTLKAPVGVKIQAVLRRGAPPWNSIGLNTFLTGTGAWQKYNLPITTTASITNARLDFGVPSSSTIGLDDVKLTTTFTNVSGIFGNGRAINIAHHPNRGHNPLDPQSLYYPIVENADQVALPNNRKGSSYLTAGSNLLTSGITPGANIRIRTNGWTLSDRKIASISGARLYFDTPTPAPLQKDWGYFVYGQRWMLDEPGEWHYDAPTKTIYVWMADSAAPGSRVSVNQSALGIQASYTSHVRIDGLAIRHMGTGVKLQSATNVVLRNLIISDILGVGLDANVSTDSGIENSQIARTMGDAISASPSERESLRFHAYDNLITESGVQYKNGVISSLPAPVRAAIEAGKDAVIRGNRIYGAGYIGILPIGGSLVSGNHIENTCLILDDCGAIYTIGHPLNSVIENNTIHHVVGARSGKPANLGSLAHGIYLDELSSGVTVRGNTVVDADNGIQLHNAANNLIENNTLYGLRRNYIWLQEGSKRLHADGDIYGNKVLNNRLFSTSTQPAISQQTYLPKTNTDRFAVYDRNRYFTYFWPTISSETWPGGTKVYTLPKWQKAVTSTNIPRNLDIKSSEVNSANLGYAGFHTLGGNLVPNGNFSSGVTGWSAWNLTSPRGQMVLQQCTPTIKCLRYAAGASKSSLISTNFSVQQNQWYKISFDLKTGINGQMVDVVARRGGGGDNYYEELMGAPYKYTASGTTNLQRYSFIFKALQTVNANDPITLDNGARIDFFNIMPGQNITVANLEIVPLSTIETTLRSHILINPYATTMKLNCPDGADALLCSEYVRFTDGQSIIWPYAVPPHASEIIYSRNSDLVDGDGDGIPDYQDICNGTPIAQAVNGAGCTLGQN